MSPENHYAYLPLEEDTIRVIRFEPDNTADQIRCTLVHLRRYRDNDTAPYLALSYCWGDASDTKMITLDGQPFKVTTNLYDALTCIHTNQGYYIWIDAICINQSDLEERNSQVREMWQIFKSAELVVSWLGQKDEDTDLVFDAAGALGEPETSKSLTLAWETESLMYVPFREGETPGGGPVAISRAWGKPILDMCCRKYFERAWVIPEVLQARRAIVLCGNRWMGWSQFQSIVVQSQVFWDLASDNTLPAIMIHSPAVLQAVRICEVRSMLRSGREFRDAEEIFYDILDFYAISRCTDVRDHIFAFMTDPRIRQLELLPEFRVDYSLTPEQLSLVVIAQLTSLIRAAGHCPGQMYDTALVVIATALQLNISSQTYFDWLKPQIARVYESGRTQQGNAVYLIELKGGLSIYLDTFQLRRIRTDSDFAQYITSPADLWEAGEDGGTLRLEDFNDEQLVITVRKRDEKEKKMKLAVFGK